MKCSKCKVKESLSYHNYCRLCKRIYEANYRKQYLPKYHSTYYVYVIENKVTGKKYYGSTKRRDRWSAHKNNALSFDRGSYLRPLYIDMRKYGADNFSFTKLMLYPDKLSARVGENFLISRNKKAIYNAIAAIKR